MQTALHYRMRIFKAKTRPHDVVLKIVIKCIIKHYINSNLYWYALQRITNIFYIELIVLSLFISYNSGNYEVVRFASYTQLTHV